MKNYLLTGCALMLLAVSSGAIAQNYIYTDGNNTRIGSRAQKQDPWVTYFVLSDKEFDQKINETNPSLDPFSINQTTVNAVCQTPKQDTIWVMFHLPKDSDKVEVFIRKGYVKAKFVQKVYDFIYNTLYVYSVTAEMPIGYHDMRMYQDSRGNWEYSLTNSFNSNTQLEVVGNVVLFRSQFNSPRQPLGSIQGSLSRTVERVDRNAETYLFMVEKTALRASAAKKSGS